MTRPKTLPTATADLVVGQVMVNDMLASLAVSIGNPLDNARFRVEALGERVRLRCIGTGRVRRVPLRNLLLSYSREVP